MPSCPANARSADMPDKRTRWHYITVHSDNVPAVCNFTNYRANQRLDA